MTAERWPRSHSHRTNSAGTGESAGRVRGGVPVRRHAFDVVLAALTPRAAQLARVTVPRPADLAAASTEGWIALPVAPLLPCP
jgi:hypothetical protein